MGVCPWCLTKDFSLNFLFFTNLYLHCLLFESLLQFTVKPPHFMDTRLIRTRHYNRQFALFLGKKSPYIFPKY